MKTIVCCDEIEDMKHLYIWKILNDGIEQIDMKIYILETSDNKLKYHNY